jgi:hypothetical protein
MGRRDEGGLAHEADYGETGFAEKGNFCCVGRHCWDTCDRNPKFAGFLINPTHRGGIPRQPPLWAHCTTEVRRNASGRLARSDRATVRLQ